jgi:N-acetylmuramoyl-L-alanine amidase
MSEKVLGRFRTHVDGLHCPGPGRHIRLRSGPTHHNLRITRHMNKHTRRLSAAVTAAASAAVLSTLIAVPANAADYTVKSGDTLSAISARTGVSLNTLFSANGLGWNTIIYPGQKINLGDAAAPAPAAAPAAPASAGSTYTVKAGDTLSAIAGRTGVSLQTLFSLNNLGWNSIIYPNQVIKTSAAQAPAAAPAPAVTPAQAPQKTEINVTITPPAAPAPAPAVEQAKTYTVKAGDSLWAISTRTGVPLATLFSLNGLNGSSVIHPGQVIKLSGPAAAPAAPAVQAPAPAPAATAPSTSGTESVAEIKSMITATARSMGVDPALALAIGEQESSFRQNVTSHAGAVGTMQVMPTSGTWASELVGRQLNLRNTQDNITAGVAILRQLVKTSPSLDIAIASYYQGQYSVMNRGMYDDTKTYVSQVKNRIAKFS